MHNPWYIMAAFGTEATYFLFWVSGINSRSINHIKGTVDGRNPAPVDMVNLPLFTRVLYIPGGDRRISSTNLGSREPAGSICPEAQYSSERCQCEMSGGKLLCKNVFESIAPNISPLCFYYCVTPYIYIYNIYIHTYITLCTGVT